MKKINRSKERETTTTHSLPHSNPLSPIFAPLQPHLCFTPHALTSHASSTHQLTPHTLPNVRWRRLRRRTWQRAQTPGKGCLPAGPPGRVQGRKFSVLCGVMAALERRVKKAKPHSTLTPQTHHSSKKPTPLACAPPPPTRTRASPPRVPTWRAGWRGG